MSDNPFSGRADQPEKVGPQMASSKEVKYKQLSVRDVQINNPPGEELFQNSTSNKPW
jgi:hypothetical protein